MNLLLVMLNMEMFTVSRIFHVWIYMGFSSGKISRLTYRLLSLAYWRQLKPWMWMECLQRNDGEYPLDFGCKV